jgi:hypothetical protein
MVSVLFNCSSQAVTLTWHVMPDQAASATRRLTIQPTAAPHNPYVDNLNNCCDADQQHCYRPKQHVWNPEHRSNRTSSYACYECTRVTMSC